MCWVFVRSYLKNNNQILEEDLEERRSDPKEYAELLYPWQRE